MKKNNLELTTITDLTEEFNYEDTKYRLLIIAEYSYFFTKDTLNVFDGSFMWANSSFIKEYNKTINEYFKKKKSYKCNKNLIIKQSVCFAHNIEFLQVKADNVSNFNNNLNLEYKINKLKIDKPKIDKSKKEEILNDNIFFSLDYDDDLVN